MTVAMSLLVHGEAVRFNRGQSRGDDYDFKYMMGRDGKVYPYVSSQCYKRYWRESLPGPASPITRAKGAAGKEKNQAYTDGNPIKYVDDDLFGYMVAGAAESEEEREEDLGPPESEGERLFETDNLKDAERLRKKLLQPDNSVSRLVLDTSPGVRDILQSGSASGKEIEEAIILALNNTVKSAALCTESMLDTIPIKGKTRKECLEARTEEEKGEANRTVLMKAFGKELQEKPKRPTTRRTAPVRMHALVAFSGIKTAKDFQTFSRDVVYTGGNSIVNPVPQGIYSAWLKTRILIESHRIGKFYIGNNMDLLDAQITDEVVKTEKNPYSRDSDTLRFVKLDETIRTDRLRAVLKALADIGNERGPASGALHDGSLRPKAFVAGMMTCADSPFDDVWKGRIDEAGPFLDIATLVDNIKDWDDLFATKKLYFGLPHDVRTTLEEAIRTELTKLEFDALIDSPRKALLQLAKDAVL